MRKAYGSYSTSTPGSSGGIGSAFTYLPRKEWEVLRYLAENPGKLASKDELHQMVWPDAHVGPAAIDRAVSEVRPTGSEVFVAGNTAPSIPAEDCGRYLLVHVARESLLSLGRKTRYLTYAMEDEHLPGRQVV